MSWLEKFVILVLSLLGEVIAKPTEDYERMMLRSQMDLDAGATSYVYRSDNNGPPQIYYLTGDGLNNNFPSYKPSQQNEVVPYIYSQPYASAYPISYYPPQTKSELILPIASSELDAPIVRSEYVAPMIHSKELDAPMVRSEYHAPMIHSRELEVPMFRSEYIAPVIHSSEERADHSGDDSSSSIQESNEGGGDYSRSNGSDENKKHLIEGGHAHEEKFNKKKGKKSKKNYKKQFNFAKGMKGSYNQKHGDGDYGEIAEKKDSHYNQNNQHTEHDAADKNEKGGQFDKKKHHKKGSKSKGYHNVFMKDEYKKDHTFYGKLDELV